MTDKSNIDTGHVDYSPFSRILRGEKVDPWWNATSEWSGDPDDALQNPAMTRRMKTGKGTNFSQSLYHLSEEVVPVLHKRFGEPVLISFCSSGSGAIGWATWIWDEGMVRLSGIAHNRNIEIASLNPDDIDWMLAETKTLKQNTGDHSPIWMASRKSGRESINFQRMGYVKSPLVGGNYPADVLEKFEAALKDLEDPHPEGRIVLLDGPAGSGKTYMLRGIIHSTSNAAFVIVNPKNYEDLMDPEFIYALQTAFMDEDEINKIVLILEDADALLAPREKGSSLSGLSSALNMGDGLLSELLDIRIIATTNTEKENIDPAITRDGRLSQHIHIGALPLKQAQDAYAKLTGKDPREFPLKKGDTEVMLSSVYKAARKAGWRPQGASVSRNLYEAGDEPISDHEKKAASIQYGKMLRGLAKRPRGRGPLLIEEDCHCI